MSAALSLQFQKYLLEKLQLESTETPPLAYMMYIYSTPNSECIIGSVHTLQNLVTHQVEKIWFLR